MSMRENLIRAKRGMSGGDALSKGSLMKKTAGFALNFLLGFAMSFARVFSTSSPFGLAMVARAGGGGAGAFCLLGTVLGYVVSGGFDWGIRYIAAAVLVYTASFVFHSLAIYSSSWFMPVMVGGITAITGLLEGFETTGSMPYSVLLVTEIVLSGIATRSFSLALSGEDRTSETEEMRYNVSMVVLIATLLMALSQFNIMHTLSVGRTIALVLVMMSSFKCGTVFGSATGAAFGFAMDVANGGYPFFTMAYAFSGMISGLLSRHGRLVFILGYILANVTIVLWTWAEMIKIDALFECFAASMIFIAMPNDALDYVGGLIREPRLGIGDTGLRRYTAERMYKMSSAFRKLFETVHETMTDEANDYDISTAFDRAADAVCIKCKNREKCWHIDYIDTLSVINDASPKMLARGRLEQDDLAPRFLKKCKSSGALVGAVNSELRGTMYRKSFASRIAENKTAAYAQYLDIAEILNSVSKELKLDCPSDPIAERRLLRYLSSVDVEASVAVFRDSRSRLRATIESKNCEKLVSSSKYLEELSAVLGTRLCYDKNVDLSAGKLVFMEAEPLAVSVGIASLKKQGEAVSGDRGTYFKTDEGVLCVILSDGMGSGAEAQKESAETVSILEGFLKSGVAPELAMKMLNSVLLLKNGDCFGYATVDLMCIDLFNGETCFYKYGAAPSYVWSGKNVQRVRGESLAPGFGLGEASEPDIVRMRIKPGGRALVVSDGVLADSDDKWLRDMISGHDTKDAKTLARDALRTAANTHGSSDDMTVLVVFVQERA